MCSLYIEYIIKEYKGKQRKGKKGAGKDKCGKECSLFVYRYNSIIEIRKRKWRDKGMFIIYIERLLL